jgi:hypothetical protein
MDQARVAKKIFDSKPGSRRKLGSPRLRWLEHVENGVRELNVKRWREKAYSKEKWASVLKETKVLRGP